MVVAVKEAAAAAAVFSTASLCSCWSVGVVVVDVVAGASVARFPLVGRLAGQPASGRPTARLSGAADDFPLGGGGRGSQKRDQPAKYWKNLVVESCVNRSQ